jgi:hypothetical protein
MPQGGNITVGPGSEGAIAGPGPDIFTISVVGSQLIINGRNFTGITHVTLQDPTTGTAKPFAVKIANLTQLISDSIDTMSVPVNKGLDLILANAYGQTTYPVTFTLQPNAVATANIQPNAVTAGKIPDAGIPVSKLNPLPFNPNHGDVLAWDKTTTPGKFMFVPFSGGGGGGGISSIIRGDGIASPGTNITAPGGTIAVDRGETGDLNDFKIPYFNNSNKIVLDSTTSPSGQLTGIIFKDGANTFDIYNDTGFLDIVNHTGTKLFSLDYSGDLKLKGSSVCTQATGCSGAPGSTVTSVTATAPLGFTGTTNVVINAGAVNTPGNLVRLDGTGAIPSTVKGVVSSITAGPAISVTPSTGTVTVGVLFGPGNAQRHQTYLDNLGTLNPNDNYMIIGNGTSWEVQGGATLLNSIDPELASLAGLSPAVGNIIVGASPTWTTSTIPSCASGNFNFSNGTSFACSISTSPLSAGTITTFNQVGLQLKAPTPGTSTGELHFLGTNNTNYVGLKAADATASNTVWTLPAADGSSGFVLSTDGAGNLSWIDLGSGNNVSGIAPSTDKAIPRWSGITGKIIQNSGVIIDDSNNVTGTNAFTSSGNMTVDTNTFFVDASGNKVGIGTATPNSTLDIIGGSNLGIHLKQGAQSTATSGAFKNGLVLEKSSAANAFALGYNTSDLFSIDHFDGTATYKNLFTLNSSGNGQFIGSLKVGAYTLPSNDGSNNQVLTTNGTGTLSWANLGGANDVANAGTSTTGNLSSFSDTTGKLIQDSGIAASNVVTNWAASNLDAVPRFFDTTGKRIQNSGVYIDNGNNVLGIVNFSSTGNMMVDSNTFFVDSVGNKVGILNATPTEALDVRGNARLGNGGYLRFYDAGGAKYVGLQSAAAVATSVTWSLPPADGTPTQVLSTNGSGALSWTSVGGPNDVSNAGTSTSGNLASYNGTTGKIIQDSGIASANVVTMNPAAGSADRILTSQGANRIATPTSVFINGSGDVSGVGNFTSTGSFSNTGGLTNTGNLNIDAGTLYVDSTGNRVGIGTTSPNANAILDLTSTTMGLLLPRMTTVQRDLIGGGTPTDGLLIYNTTTKTFNGRINNNWESVTGDVYGPPSSVSGTLASFNGATGKIIQDSGILAANVLVKTLTSANIFVGNVSNVATGVAVTGDIGISNTGVTSITAGVIVDADINGSAAITRSKLANGTVNTIAYNNSTGVMSDSTNLKWDSTNKQLTVTGQAASNVYNNIASTTFDFNNGNVQYTSANCGAITLQNMVDGGSYQVIIQGATSGTCTFSHAGLTFRYAPANGVTTAASHSVYSMTRIGTIVYVSWITGFI